MSSLYAIRTGQSKRLNDRIAADGGIGRLHDDEQELLARLDAGETVVLNLKRHELLAYKLNMEERLERIDRRSLWGNPFRIGKDGNRATVIQRYQDEHLPVLRQVLVRGGWPDADMAFRSLRGRALACWCAPAPCHGDVLAELAERSSW